MLSMYIMKTQNDVTVTDLLLVFVLFATSCIPSALFQTKWQLIRIITQRARMTYLVVSGV